MKKLWDKANSRAASCSAARPPPARRFPCCTSSSRTSGLHGVDAVARRRARRAPRGPGAPRRPATSAPWARSTRAPTASTRRRSCATSTRAACAGGVREWEIVAEEKEIEVAPGVKYAAWTYNGRVPGPDAARPRGRAAAGPLHQRRPTHPHTIHFHGIHRDLMDGVPGIGAGNIAPGRVDHLRVRRHAVRPPPLPLPLDAARRAHRQGPLRRVHHRPEGGPPAGRRARDGHERVRHELRPLERGLRGQHRRVRLHAPSRCGSSAASWCGSTWSTCSSSTSSTRSTSTRTSSTTTRPARGSSRATSPTR